MKVYVLTKTTSVFVDHRLFSIDGICPDIPVFYSHEEVVKKCLKLNKKYFKENPMLVPQNPYSVVTMKIKEKTEVKLEKF